MAYNEKLSVECPLYAIVIDDFGAVEGVKRGFKFFHRIHSKLFSHQMFFKTLSLPFSNLL